MAWAVNRTGALESSGALRLRVALLPVGHDPDTFLRTTGAAAFEERIGAARSLLSNALDRTIADPRSEEHTSELQSLAYLVCRLLLEKKKKRITRSAQMQLM